MGQVSKYLRSTSYGWSHWCPACKEMHSLFDTWHFNGNVDKPTFTPSFKHEGTLTTKDENGEWAGDWVRDASGKGIKYVCHYVLTDGILNYCGDCTHELRDQKVPLPELPKFYQDP